MSRIQERALSDCQHKIVSTNCKKCGVYLHQGNRAVKTNLYDSLINCSAAKYLKHIRKRENSIIENKEIQQPIWSLLQLVCQKFQYTIETLALGIFLFAKTHQKHEKDEKFWATSSLLVASKGIELDRRVPYLHRFQKYAEKSFSQDQYEVAERTIFQEMNYNIQFSTFITFIQFYMTNGFLFQKDCLQYHKIKQIQDQILIRCKQMLKNGSFLSYRPENLALSLIKQVRVNNRLDPWCKQLQKISEHKSEQVVMIEKNNVLKPICALSIKAREKLSSISHNSNHNTLASLQSSGQLIDNKPKLIRRKNESAMKHNVKQNSFRPPMQIHQTLLSNIRGQALSVTKYPSMNCSLHSTIASQKLIPLIGYQNRRL